MNKCFFFLVFFSPSVKLQTGTDSQPSPVSRRNTNLRYVDTFTILARKTTRAAGRGTNMGDLSLGGISRWKRYQRCVMNQYDDKDTNLSPVGFRVGHVPLNVNTIILTDMSLKAEVSVAARQAGIRPSCLDEEEDVHHECSQAVW